MLTLNAASGRLYRGSVSNLSEKRCGLRKGQSLRPSSSLVECVLRTEFHVEHLLVSCVEQQSPIRRLEIAHALHRGSTGLLRAGLVAHED